MRLFSLRPAALALLTVSTIVLAGSASAQLPLLEKYTLDSVGEGRGTVYDLRDRSLGGGDANAAIRVRRSGSTILLSLRVWRRVPRGRTSLALLGEKVEVRGYDGEALVYLRDFEGLEADGIFFGDSQSGDWRRTLRDIPAVVRKIEVTFLGNYE